MDNEILEMVNSMANGPFSPSSFLVLGYYLKEISEILAGAWIVTNILRIFT